MDREQDNFGSNQALNSGNHPMWNFTENWNSNQSLKRRRENEEIDPIKETENEDSGDRDILDGIVSDDWQKRLF